VAAYAGTIALGGVLLIRSLPSSVRIAAHGTQRLWVGSIAVSLALLLIAAAAPDSAQGVLAVVLALAAVVPMSMAYRLIP
jgi:hypothetical protein